jgi:hypothetical protein
MASLKKLLKAKPGTGPGSNPTRAVIGLRNPGPDYEGTRHNSGYEVLARGPVRPWAGALRGFEPKWPRSEQVTTGSSMPSR